MSANVNFYNGGPGLFQAVTTTPVRWQWQLGDGASYWGFSVRPSQANNQVEIRRLFTVSDNDLVQTTFLDVLVSNPTGPNIREGGGGLLNFAAIGSS